MLYFFFLHSRKICEQRACTFFFVVVFFSQSFSFIHLQSSRFVSLGLENYRREANVRIFLHFTARTNDNGLATHFSGTGLKMVLCVRGAHFAVARNAISKQQMFAKKNKRKGWLEVRCVRSAHRERI